MSMSTIDGNVTIVTAELIFTGASREDTGVYECSVSNLLNYVTRSATLTIQCKQAKIIKCSNSYLMVIIIMFKELRMQHHIIVLIESTQTHMCTQVQ